MKENIKNASRIGLLFGVILSFTILFGLTTTLSEIVGDLFSLPSKARAGNTGGLMVIFALMAFWAGSQASKHDRSDWKPVLTAGLFTGLAMALLVGLFTFLIGTMDAAGVDIRDYLEQINRQTTQFLLYGRGVWAGTLITFAILFIFGAI